ncbi:hypothetical protein A2U01_0025786, partial [Trifolium medium]|nr:hypothetical protein [Trifolium medium]
KFEERVNAAAKTEEEYISMIAVRLNSIRARYWKDAEAKNQLTSPSASGELFISLRIEMF